MSKEVLKNLINLLDDKDVGTIYNVLIRFIPDTEPFPDEIEALKKAEKSIETYGVVSQDDLPSDFWD